VKFKGSGRVNVCVGELAATEIREGGDAAPSSIAGTG